MFLRRLFFWFDISLHRYLVIFGGLLEFIWKVSMLDLKKLQLRFISPVILRLNQCLKVLLTSFLTFSAWDLYKFSKQAEPFSRYKIILSSLNFPPNTLRMYTPASSQIFVPSNLPIITSKSGSPSLLVDTDFSSNMRFSRVCYGVYFFFTSLLPWKYSFITDFFYIGIRISPLI